jgi:uncharacterized repeat protein (TIGR03803 family)
LVQATDGDFYGTTYAGGIGFGTVFKITSGGSFTSLYSFCSQSFCSDGASPHASLIQATDGNLYGTTSGGEFGYGTIFKVTLSGTLTTLYNFCSEVNCLDGAIPLAGLVQAADGAFYGTTAFYGADGRGSIFKITPGGSFASLYSFCSQSNCSDGANPEAALIQATDGNFYGTTVFGGTEQGSDCLQCDTIFKFTPAATLTSLYSFCVEGVCSANPYAALVQDTNGSFYGTAQYGGANFDGTVFSLSVNLGIFVSLQPASGEVGATIRILGTDLAGTTSVSFNGTPAVFKMVSKTEILATVPNGATSGFVTITQSIGPTKSNVKFRVVP